jgi:hypothetical protein
LTLEGETGYEKVGELATLLRNTEKQLDEVFKRFERELTVL